MNARHRAVIVVFDDTVTEVEANLIRGGLRMFTGVRQVVPVHGVPSDLTAARKVAQKDLADAYAQAVRERDEIAEKLRSVQAVVTPAKPGEDGDQLAWRRTS